MNFSANKIFETWLKIIPISSTAPEFCSATISDAHFVWVAVCASEGNFPKKICN